MTTVGVTLPRPDKDNTVRSITARLSVTCPAPLLPCPPTVTQLLPHTFCRLFYQIPDRLWHPVRWLAGCLKSISTARGRDRSERGTTMLTPRLIDLMKGTIHEAGAGQTASALAAGTSSLRSVCLPQLLSHTQPDSHWTPVFCIETEMWKCLKSGYSD